MKTRILSALFACLAVAAFSASAQAGLFHHKNVCDDGCGCETVIQQVQKTIYEKQEVPCEKTVWEKVPYKKTVDCVKYEKVVETKKVEYTVCEQVTVKKKVKVDEGKWVKKPVQVPEVVCCKVAVRGCLGCVRYKTVKKETGNTITVEKDVWEPKWVEKEIECKEYKPVVKTKECKYTVCKPVTYKKEITCYKWESKKVQGTKTICVPKTITVDVPVTICPEKRCTLFGKHRRHAPVVADDCGCK
ncbi:hypothetical protein FACS18942_05610 [Planctomycetales bacterium]|nr:hypothetical protein FACS18942_05610 [Planctomycetales bacterium]